MTSSPPRLNLKFKRKKQQQQTNKLFKYLGVERLFFTVLECRRKLIILSGEKSHFVVIALTWHTQKYDKLWQSHWCKSAGFV